MSSEPEDVSDVEFVPPAPRGRRGRGATTRPAAARTERWRNRESEDEDFVAPPRPFKPRREPGPACDKTAPWSPLELFRLFFSDRVVGTLIKNTNRNAVRRRETEAKAYTRKWTPLAREEFFVFLAIVLFSGLVQVPERSDFWKNDVPYGFRFPANVMSRDRWEAIMWSLHLSDPDEEEENERKRGTDSYDRLFKIKPLYTDIIAACQSHYHPSQNIAIDERMVKSKARVHFKQYMKSKPTKWGFKLFVLADSLSAYTWNFSVYVGKRETAPARGKGLSYSAVTDLLPFDLLGTGYRLYVDSFYTSPALFRYLDGRKIGCCGTVRKGRVGFPKTRENDLTDRAERGDVRWIREDALLFVKWMDTRQVAFCTSLHKAYSERSVDRRVREAGKWSVKKIPAPDAALDYNRHMGAVDLSDAFIKYYSVHHKTMKWYKTFFFHFVDIAAVNSWLLHKELCAHRRTAHVTHKQFMESLIREMVELSERGREATAPVPGVARPDVCVPLYLHEKKSSDVKDATAHRGYCALCAQKHNKRQKTPMYCGRCDVALCLVPTRNCFADWHRTRR